MSARALTIIYLTLWLAAIAGTALARAGAELQDLDAPHRALEPSLGTLGALLTHNSLVALWPLALTLIGWPTLTGARLLGDTLITAQLLVHGVLVGSALGQHPQLWRYLPHLPLEWLAIAIPAAAWLTARIRPGHPHDRCLGALPTTVAVLAALAGAAAIETYLIPVS